MSQTDKNLFHVAALLYSYKSDNFKTENVLKKIIESMLIINRNEMHTCIELSVEIKKRMNMVTSVDEIEAIVCDRKNKGFSVDYSNGEIKFCLKEKRYDHIMSMNTRNMDSYIQEFIQLNSYTEVEKDIIERYLYNFYRKNFNDLQNALGKRKDAYLQMDSTQFTNEEFEIVCKFNEWEKDGKNEQMLALASYALEYTLLAGDTELKGSTHIGNVFGGKNIYIDTNILFYCLGINGEAHEESNKMFLRRCKSCKENIVVSYYTDAELRSTFAHFEEEINRLNNPLIHNAKVAMYFSNNDVYHHYIKWSKGKRQLNEGKYFIRFLLDKYDELVKEFDITVERAMPFQEDKLAEDEKIREYEAEIVRTSTLNYDARNVYFIEKKRKPDEMSLQSVKDIFISADRQLQYWDMHREKCAPVVISPNTWLLLIARLIGRNDDDFKCFISYINQANREKVINNKEFLEVLKTVYEIVEDVKQQESVVEVMVSEEFAFLENNGEKRSTEFIVEKTQEKTYAILEKRVSDLSCQLDVVKTQMDEDRKASEEKEQQNYLAYQSLEGKMLQRDIEYQNETLKLKQETEEKDKTIAFLQKKLSVYPRVAGYILIACVITIPLLIELYSIFVMKNQTPLSYQICMYFYEKSIFDDGNKVEAYGKILVGLTSLLILTADVCIIKQIVKLIMKLKGGDVS